MRQLTALLLASLCAVTLMSRPARATKPTLAVVLPFDSTTGEMPESIALDSRGNLYFTLGNTIQRRTVDGTRSIWATLPIAAFALGVKVGPDGCVYTASTSLSASPGAYVWRACGDSQIEVYAALDQSGGPNDLAFDHLGNLYVTDAFLGQIWQVTKERTARVWLADPLLEGSDEAPALGFHAVGVDGIAFDARERHLYLGNLDMGQVLRVPILRDGSAGKVTVFASDPGLIGMDGIAFDHTGNLYVAINSQDRLAVVDRRGEPHWLHQGAPLDGPSSLAFGTVRGQRNSLFVVSSSFSRTFGYQTGTPAPAILQMQTPCSGLPLPGLAVTHGCFACGKSGTDCDC